MQIELKSSRRWIFYICLSSLIVFNIIIIFMTIALIFDYTTILKDFTNLFLFISFIVFDFIYIIILVLAKFLKRKRYIFTEDEIKFYDKKEALQKTLQITNIEYMRYYSFRLRDIFGFMTGYFFGETPMEIQIKECNGEKSRIGFIELNDVKKLEQIYPNLLTINYNK